MDKQAGTTPGYHAWLFGTSSSEMKNAIMLSGRLHTKGTKDADSSR